MRMTPLPERPNDLRESLRQSHQSIYCSSVKMYKMYGLKDSGYQISYCFLYVFNKIKKKIFQFIN
jgi:hypothetical protein